MAQIEKTVFISYRRADETWALAIFQDLTQHGYDVFIDYDGIASGRFGDVILENIRARAHFLVLLTPTALERCGDPKDWMRREIDAALDNQRNIVPVMLEGFKFDTPTIAKQLNAGKLADLKEYNGLEIPGVRYFSSEMERLRNRFLNVPLNAVLHSASISAQQVAAEQKDKAVIAVKTESRGRVEEPVRPVQQDELFITPYSKYNSSELREAARLLAVRLNNFHFDYYKEAQVSGWNRVNEEYNAELRPQVLSLYAELRRRGPPPEPGEYLRSLYPESQGIPSILSGWPIFGVAPAVDAASYLIVYVNSIP
jgi:hypothetical protein